MDPRASASAEHDSVESGNISQWLKPPDPLSSVLSVSPDAIPSSFPSDFIKFLALAQKMELDFIPITWQPSLPRLGFGGTAELSQSFLSLQTSLAFKRVNLYKRDDNPAGYRDSTLKRIMAETWALSIPQIRDHPSVVQIEGVCWELDPSGGYFWPVLVYDKAERGDLSEFSNSHSWKDLCSEERLRLCFDIGDAIMTMHNNGNSVSPFILQPIRAFRSKLSLIKASYTVI